MEPHCLLVRGLTPLFHPPPPHTSCFRLYSWWDLLEGSGQDWKWNSYTPTPPTKSGILIACLNGSHHWVLDVCLSLLWTHAVTHTHICTRIGAHVCCLPANTRFNPCKQLPELGHAHGCSRCRSREYFMAGAGGCLSHLHTCLLLLSQTPCLFV